MVASDSRLLHDGIERLLAPLGLRLSWIAADGSSREKSAIKAKAIGCWRLFSKQDPSESVILCTDYGEGVIGYGKLETLQGELCSGISRIWVDGHYVENPYLGCRSLEEMQIKCDLLGASSKRKVACSG